jgi:hypothetical protein
VGLLLIVSVVLNLALFVPLPGLIGSIFDKIADVLFALGLAWMGSTLLTARATKQVLPLTAQPFSG